MILFIFGFIAAIIIVVLFLWAAGKKKGMDSRLRGNGEPINPEQIEKKRENLEKVMAMAGEKGEISNDDVQITLKVSDATATNYLEELENKGELEQIGKRGRFVRYRAKIKG